MAWIESHQTLREHPKLYQIMETLKIEKPEAVGYLHLLWWWCMDYAPDGNLKSSSNLQIARGANWKKNPDVFVQSLIDAKLIDKIGNELKIHDWSDFCGALMERRLKRLEAKRPNSASNGVLPNPTQPKHTQPNPNNPPNHPLGELDIPEDLRSNSAEILEWLAYKREKGQSYKPRGLTALWRMLRLIEVSRRAGAIQNSMAMNYQGIYDKGGSNNGKGNSGVRAVPGKYDGIETVYDDNGNKVESARS